MRMKETHILFRPLMSVTRKNLRPLLFEPTATRSLQQIFNTTIPKAKNFFDESVSQLLPVEMKLQSSFKWINGQSELTTLILDLTFLF